MNSLVLLIGAQCQNADACQWLERHTLYMYMLLYNRTSREPDQASPLKGPTTERLEHLFHAYMYLGPVYAESFQVRQYCFWCRGFMQLMNFLSGGEQ